MASGVRKWESSKIVELSKQVAAKRVETAARFVESEAVRLISRDQPVRRSKSGRLVGLSPAGPNQPPKVLYGRLRQSVTHELNVARMKITGRVGTNVVYGRAHEYGKHPWLRPALYKSRDELKRIFGVGAR